MKTGVFFHPLFTREGWPILGEKFRHFPGAMEHLLAEPHVELLEPPKVSEELLLKVHTEAFLRDVRGRWYYEGARLSVGGCVEACERVMEGELQNAFVFDVAAGHHAGPSYAWGGTYLSCTGPAVANLREKYRKPKTAIIDTDSHHGDGTRAIFFGDPHTLHLCFCHHNVEENEGNKLCIDVGWRCTDEEYLEIMCSRLYPKIEEFQPDLIIHLLGHDTCQGDYGDRGLTPDFFPRAVEELKALAEKWCNGRLVVVSMGGARPDLTKMIIPSCIEVLAQRKEKESLG